MNPFQDLGYDRFWIRSIREQGIRIENIYVIALVSARSYTSRPYQSVYGAPSCQTMPDIGPNTWMIKLYMGGHYVTRFYLVSLEQLDGMVTVFPTTTSLFVLNHTRVP